MDVDVGSLPSVKLRAQAFEEIDGIEYERQVDFEIDAPLLAKLLSWSHPKQVHRLRLLCKTANTIIMTRNFARECISHFVPLAATTKTPDSNSLTEQFDRIAVSNLAKTKRSSMSFQKPSEFEELFFQWPPLYQHVFALDFMPHYTSIGRLIGFGRRRALVIPPFIGELKSLVRLDLAMSGIAGPLPDELMSLTTLEFLDLSRNRIRGEISGKVGQLVNLKHLELRDNELEGALPVEFGALSKLRHLSLAENRFSGSIPDTLCQCVQLVTLDLSRNMLSGAIPSTFGSLVSLTHLLLNNNNKLTGPIPAELGLLSRLRTLNLSKNGLSGVIPGEIGKLQELRHFLVNGNQLGGEIPASMAGMDNLEQCNLGNNGRFTCLFEFEFAY
ncbi:hypothetical protein CcCBS67573_g08223 [Chytriomyces confervae]|uniref:Disease resistance R13L4/SHOC-2-like LRR domain-containing protein n=1 Tax=Chytriomyces confervae TaxID=246404 RepID=A0A507EPC3_9FUNG|nr:hypothetical protein CcCBS67573_g08223 [Chytriomyces confervae]